MQSDFTVPTEGYESPWAMAQVVFMYDTADMRAAAQRPRRSWTGPRPIRAASPIRSRRISSARRSSSRCLIELTDDSDTLSKPVDEADYAAVTGAALGVSRRADAGALASGSAYPATGPAQLQLMADDEIDLAISFSPGEASTAIANNELPDTVRTFVLDDGTLGNASYRGDPLQFRRQGRGDGRRERPAVARGAGPRAGSRRSLATAPCWRWTSSSDEDRATFDALDLGVATLSPEELGTAPARAASELDDPHRRGLDPPLRRRSVDPMRPLVQRIAAYRRGAAPAVCRLPSAHRACVPALTLLAMLGPVCAGLLGTVLPGLRLPARGRAVEPVIRAGIGAFRLARPFRSACACRSPQACSRRFCRSASSR